MTLKHIISQASPHSLVVCLCVFVRVCVCVESTSLMSTLITLWDAHTTREEGKDRTKETNRHLLIDARPHHARGRKRERERDKDIPSEKEEKNHARGRKGEQEREKDTPFDSFYMQYYCMQWHAHTTQQSEGETGREREEKREKETP